MSKRRTFIKIFVILGLILLVAGVAVFVGGMTAGGWDFSILNTVRYTQKSYDAEGAVTSVHIEYSDASISVEYSDWWFNVRASNTEPLLRLIVEAKDKATMEAKRDELLALIRG